MDQQTQRPHDPEWAKRVLDAIEELKNVAIRTEAVKESYKLGLPMPIRIKGANHGDKVAARQGGDPWQAFEICVKDRFSQPVSYTEGMEWRLANVFSNKLGVINPKETFELELPLDEMFAIDAPGSYKVNIQQIISLGGKMITTVAPALIIIVVE
jgi:hypothetical protein